MSAHLYLGVMCDSVRTVGCIMGVCVLCWHMHTFSVGGGITLACINLYTPACTSKDICMGVKLFTCMHCT